MTCHQQLFSFTHWGVFLLADCYEEVVVARVTAKSITLRRGVPGTLVKAFISKTGTLFVAQQDSVGQKKKKKKKVVTPNVFFCSPEALNALICV